MENGFAPRRASGAPTKPLPEPPRPLWRRVVDASACSEAALGHCCRSGSGTGSSSIFANSSCVKISVRSCKIPDMSCPCSRGEASTTARVAQPSPAHEGPPVRGGIIRGSRCGMTWGATGGPQRGALGALHEGAQWKPQWKEPRQMDRTADCHAIAEEPNQVTVLALPVPHTVPLTPAPKRTPRL